MKSNEEVLTYIKQLQNHEGYVQFSDTKIREDDIYSTEDIIADNLKPTKGFVYEAHFCNDVESIAIKQVNAEWLVSTTKFSEIQNRETDIETYFAHGKNVKMAQIWKEEADEFCEGMEVKKLKKVVFAGFVGGEL